MFDMSIMVQMAGGRAVPIEYDLPQSEVKKRYTHLANLIHVCNSYMDCFDASAEASCASSSTFFIHLMYKIAWLPRAIMCMQVWCLPLRQHYRSSLPGLWGHP